MTPATPRKGQFVRYLTKGGLSELGIINNVQTDGTLDIRLIKGISSVNLEGVILDGERCKMAYGS